MLFSWGVSLYLIVYTRVNSLGARNHQSRENSTLRGNQFRDAFSPEREHLRKLFFRKGCLFARALHFDKLAVFGCNKIKVHRDGFVLRVVEIEYRRATEH